MKLTRRIRGGLFVAVLSVLGLTALVTPAAAAPCPYSLTPTCVAVTQLAPAAGAALQGTATLESTARQNEPARGNITHVEWWLYHPSFKTQNPNNEEGKLLLDERVNQPPSSGTLTSGTWRGSWTIPANRSMTARDGDYLHDGLRTYTLPLDGQYSIETHVLDAEWDRTYGGPPGRSGQKNVSINFGSGGSTPPAPSSNMVQIGMASFPLSGTNIARAAGALVRYTATATSPANQWGFEVSVSSAGQILARSAYQLGMAIPAGGSVLSGHDAAADWLNQYGAVGAKVTFLGGSAPAPAPTPTPTATANPAPGPAPANSVQIGTASFPLSGTNIARAAGALVRYTGTATSPANQWGFEVSVSSAGKILARSAYQLGMAIPAGGSVLSGHDAAANWLDQNGVVGATVTFPGGSAPAPAPTPTATATTAPGPVAANSVQVGAATHVLTGTNIARTAGALVRYTGTATSPANQWGFEVSVSSAGKVLARSAYQLGMAIPAGGSVLSGHDESADWLDANGVVGATVTYPSSGTAPGATATPVATQTTAPTGLALTGRWTMATSSMPLRAMHVTQLRDGRVLLLAGSGNNPDAFAAKQFKAAVWNPGDNTFLNLTVPEDMFCSGHATLPDGRILIQGGTLSYAGVPAGEAFRGLKSSYIFDPATNAFSRTNDTIEGHWYPTLTKIENGNIWAAGGYTDKSGGGPSTSTEMFNSAAGSWMTAAQVPQTNRYWGTYPHMFLMADGRMFYTGGHTFGNAQPGSGAMIYDWRNALVGDVPGLRDKELRDQAGSVLLPPAQNQTFMIAGGGSVDNGGNTNSVDIINLNDASPTYRPGPTLPGPGRLYLNLTTLPDRTVLASNGGAVARGSDVLSASIYSPEANGWTSVAADPIGRNYHSASILMPDGRVAVFGSNPADDSYELRISIYEPPYLFKGTRPTITSAATDVTYGQSFGLGVTGTVTSASLTSPGSPTHQTDTNVRMIDLPITGSGTARSAVIPANRALVPPGPYMLTVLDDKKVPSVAKWINVR